MASGTPDRQRWRALQPLLDELLDLPAAARADRLQALRITDPEAAAALADWLDRLAQLEHTGFLQVPALPTPAGLAGEVVGAYTLVRELGSGGMGSVWLARRNDGRYDGEVAIKFLSAGLFTAAEAERFAREGHIMARLAHPHIARLLDAGHLAGPGPATPYLVLEYVAGVPIDAYCSSHALALADVLRLFLDVLDAVAHAHNRLILHRDLKPSNILVSAQGEVKLLDFGIAKLLDGADSGELTRQAGNAFTPQYAAPEQLLGGDVTTATDVHALGVLLFRLLGGRLPLQAPGDSTVAQWQAVLERVPPPVSTAALEAGTPEARRRARALRGDLDTIVARALKKQAADRYPNAAALADDLRRHLAHTPITARPDTWAYRGSRFVRRHRWPLLAGGLVAAALTTSATVAQQQARQARQQQAQAEGLIEFMLSDLPARLKPVGRLDALDAVGARALAYYAAQAPGSLDAESLGRRARALHLMGAITEQTGQLDEAARRFGEAAASTGELLARRPDDPDRLYNHAQSQFWVGFIARRRGRGAEAEPALRAYQALTQQLAARDPQNTDWQAEAAYGHEAVGVLWLESGRAAEALGAFGEALQVWQRLVPQRPAHAMDQANALGWSSKAREALNDLGAAAADQQAKLQALERVPDAARNREVQHLAAVAHLDTARLLQALGRSSAAQAALDTAQQLLAVLTDLDPRNLDWQAQLGSVLASQAEWHLGTPRGAQALAALQRLAAPLLAAPQRKARWWLVLQGRMLVLQARSQAPGAVAGLQDWLAAVADFEARGQTLDAEQAGTAAGAGLALGDALRQRGDLAGATTAWQAARRRLQDGPPRRDVPGSTLEARLAWRLAGAQPAAAQALRQRAEELASSHPHHPDVRLLRSELSLAQPQVPGR